MSRSKRSKKAPAQPANAPERAKNPDPGHPYEVIWHPKANTERLAIKDERERAAVVHASELLAIEGPNLRFPHQSGIKGKEGKGFRELRPRRGRSRWRPIYRRVSPSAFVIFAVGPEATMDQGGFDAAVADARARFEELELD